MDKFSRLTIEALNAETDEDRWLAELQMAVVGDPRCEDICDDYWRFSILFETCRRLNNRAGLAAGLLSLGEDMSEVTDSMTDVVEWAVQLHNLTPKRDFWRNEPVSYAQECHRCWCGITICFCQSMLHLASLNLDMKPMNFGYDPKYVKIQLEIEAERVLGSCSPATEVGPFDPSWLRLIFDVDDNRTVKIRLRNRQRAESQRKWFVPKSIMDGAGDWKSILFDASEHMSDSDKTKVLAFLNTQ